MINPITFDSYEATLKRDKAFYSHFLSSVYKTFQTSTLPPIIPSQRFSPPRCCNLLDTVYEHPLPFETSPVITPPPERIVHGSKQHIWDQFSIDRNRYTDWYDGLDRTGTPPIVDVRGPVAEGLLVYITVTPSTPYSAMDRHDNREQYRDTVLCGIPQYQHPDQKNSTKQDNDRGLDKDRSQKDRKRKDQGHDQDEDQGTPQRGNTGSGQKRKMGRPPGAPNKCKYCKVHKLSECIRNEPHPCSNCASAKRDKRICDGYGIEKAVIRGRGKPRTKCDHCHDSGSHYRCDRNKTKVNAVYPCSRCERENIPCLPLPAGYPISQVPHPADEDKDEDEDKGQAQVEEKPRLHQSPLTKSGPSSPPAVSNEADAGTLDTVLTTSLTSLPTDPDPRHWDGSKRSPTWQPLSIPPPSSSHSASDPTKSEDERLVSMPSTYHGQQCHNCIKFEDICDRYQPCSACTNNRSRGKCLSAELPTWAKFDLEGELREEDNKKAREIERRLHKFLA
jgi:hypothetical protein